MGNIIGYACGGLSIAFVLFSIWSAARGSGEGMVPMLLGFALLLVAVFTLKPSRTRA